MFGVLDISASGLVAQRTRLDVISANLASKDAIVDAATGQYAPYRRRIPVFAPGDPASGNPLGVHVQKIALDSAPLQPRYEPGSPYADGQGNVYYPNVDPSMELVNGLEAMRAYEANITAAEATKQMIQGTLRLLA
jgi:flagellar basal-body rod protein FlgC